jgi:hypothetical protein
MSTGYCARHTRILPKRLDKAASLRVVCEVDAIVTARSHLDPLCLWHR